VTFADPHISQEDLYYVPKLDERMQWNAVTLENEFDAICVATEQSELGFDLGVLKALESVVVEYVAAGIHQ
jgi:hypothetical protein